MSTLSSNDTLIASWQSISARINCYFSIFVFIFGLLGNVLNILVLSHRSLRSNSCAWLFLVSSIANFIVILSGLTSRVLSHWTTDITDTVGWLCKLRIFTLYSSRTIATWLLMLASVDRWLLTSLDVRHRKLSTLKHAQRRAIAILVFAFLLYLPVFYCYEANSLNTPLRCDSSKIACRIFADQVYSCVTIVFPLILMFLFGFLTISNVRKLKLRLRCLLLPSGHFSIHQQRFRSIDRHLLLMLLVQISCLALFTLPQAIQRIYLTITRDQHKTDLQQTIENCIYSFGILFTYLASGVPFCIYTLSGGHLFQQAFLNLIIRLKRRVLC